MQAKIEHQKKLSQFHSDSLKYWNREVSVKRRQGGLTKGLSRARSAAYSKAIWALGKGRLAQQNLVKDHLSKISRVSGQTGISRSNRYNARAFKNILEKQRQIESSLNNTFGRNMDIANQLITRNHMQQVAKNRMRLGTRPEFGAPVMMPPRDTAGQAMGTLSNVLGIAQLGFSIFSDEKLKENIKEVGKSPKGYKIYEFNYKNNKDTRYRGVMAQDIVKTNPMAVGIRDGYLTVNYSKLDVNMEVIA